MEEIRGPMLISFIVVFIIALPLVISVLKKSSEKEKEILGDNEQGNICKTRAQILAKSSYIPRYLMEKVNFVVFEKSNGERLELAIKNFEEYKLMMVGDEGLLTHQGKRYISFKKN